MCGIVGYTGNENAVSKITKGLEILEYRGYDSVGLSVKAENTVEVVKTKGRVKELKEILKEEEAIFSTCGIGHTRWATHGSVTDTNAHPHLVGKTVLVHNGIIENYKELRRALEIKGYKFKSETDTEVGCGLIDSYYRKTFNEQRAIELAINEIKGTYAFAVMFLNEKREIYAVRQGSPLIIGRGRDGYYLASDITALLPFTNEYYPLSEGEIVRLSPKEARSFNGEIVWKRTEISFEESKKGGYPHFMLKEMYDQPEAIRKSLARRIVNKVPDFTVDGLDFEFIRSVKKIHIVACGSAMHAGLVGGKMIEELAKIPTSVYIASEYRYSPPIIDKDTLVIVISQSGETADTLASLRFARENGLKALAIVNAKESSIAREADYRVYTNAGPEIAVATTKGYATQLSVLLLLSVYMAYKGEKISCERAQELTSSLFSEAASTVNAVLKKRDEITEIAKAIYRSEHVFYIGRGLDYLISQEASLKLKEISYIHSEAYPSGELKHGTISLVEKNTPVIAIATDNLLFEKTQSNLKEVKSRGALCVLITSENQKGEESDITLRLPSSDIIGNLFATMTAVQMIAYEVALLRGCDIDKPRNLAKSVTVE